MFALQLFFCVFASMPTLCVVLFLLTKRRDDTAIVRSSAYSQEMPRTCSSCNAVCTPNEFLHNCCVNCFYFR